MGGGLEVAGRYVGGLQSSSPRGTESWPEALLLAAESSRGVGKKVVVWSGEKTLLMLQKHESRMLSSLW